MLFGFTIIALLFLTQHIKANMVLIDFLISIFFLFLGLFLLALMFSRKSLIVKKEKLYRSISIFGILLFRKKIKLYDRPIVSILKVKKSQKFAFVSSANPDQSESFSSFEIYVLNKKHTLRDSVVYFKKERNAHEAVNFLIENLPLKLEIFSPDFS